MKLKTLVMDEIKPIIENYIKKIGSSNYGPDEESQWEHSVNKCIFKPKRVEKWAITNLRSYIYHDEQEGKPSYGEHVGLAVSDVVVMNQHGKSNSNRVGGFVSRKRMGVYSGTGSSTSTSHGDLIFMVGGKEVLRFAGISDPNGVKRMVTTLKNKSRSEFGRSRPYRSPGEVAFISPDLPIANPQGGLSVSK